MGSMKKCPTSQDSQSFPLKASWSVDLKLTHLDWSPEATLIHFQGHYQSVCELDYSILQGELHNTPKTKGTLDIGDNCLVEDLSSGRWHRGRIHGQKEDLWDIFLMDHGNVLSVDASRVASCPDHLLNLPPKIMCGFLSNILLFTGSSCSVMQDYFSTLPKTNIRGHIKALLPHKVLLLEVPEINRDVVLNGLGRHVDTHTFLLLVEILTQIPLANKNDPVSDLFSKHGGRNGTQVCGVQGFRAAPFFRGPKLDRGARANVRVTAAFHPGLFYCQVTSGDAELLELSKKLTAVCEDKNKPERRETTENLGSLCAVQHKDGRWYRGLVQLVALNTQVRVWFIDYGFFESVKVENVRSLPSDLYSTPLMAAPCSLSSQNDSRQLDLLKVGLLGDMLDVRIEDYDEAKHLYIVTAVKVQDRWKTDLEPEPPRINPEARVQTCTPPTFCRLPRQEKITEQLLNVTLREERVHTNSSLVGYMEYVQNPNHFWCRSRRRNTEFEEMMKEMYDHYGRVGLEEVTLSNPEIGTLCGALYLKDRHFYRGIVMDVLEHETKVLFIDFGNTSKVPHKLIVKMPEKFLTIPPFAFRCSLHDMLPAGELWTALDSTKFSKLTSNKELRIHVVQIRKSSLLVDLHDGTRRVSELMVSMNLDSTLSPRRAPDTDSQGNREQYPGRRDPQGLSVTKEFVFSSFDLSPEREEEVYVSHLSSQWEVYCQLSRNISLIEELEKNILEETMEESPCDDVERLCLAKYLDGQWYRGLAKPVLSPQHLAVFFVDYGNSSICERSDIALIRGDARGLLDVPMQAVKFTLASVPREQLYPDVRRWLEEMILYKQVRAVIRGRGEAQGAFDVELFDGDVSVNEEVSKLILGLSPKLKTLKTRKPKGSQRLPLTQKSEPRAKTLEPPEKPQKESKKSIASSTGVKSTMKSRRKKNPKTKGVSCERSSIPDKVVDAGKKKCYVSHINSVNHFFVQLADDEAAILEMYEKLQVSRSSFVEASSVEVGDIVLAKYDEDDAIYRSVVKAKVTKTRFIVDFLDYGNSSATEKIFTPPTSYLCQPRWSVTCSLMDAGAYASDVSFGEAVMGKLLVVKFLQQIQTVWKVNIEVIHEEEPSEEVEDPVEQKLTEGNSVASLSPSSSSDSCSGDSEMPSVATVQDQRLSRTSDLAAPVEISKRAEVDVLSRTRCVEELDSHDLSRETSELVNHVEKLWFLEQLLDPDIPTDEGPQRRLHFAPVVLDKPYSGLVSACVSPSDFCVVLESSLPTLTSVSSVMEGLPGDLSPFPEALVRPGESCLMELDSTWCRAEIVDVGTELLLLDLVDYGRSERLPYLDFLKLQRPPDQLLRLPRLTHPCTLRGLRPSGQQWSEEAVTFFQHRVWDADLQVIFRESSNTERLMVDVAVNGVQVNQELVLVGHASYVDPLLQRRLFPDLHRPGGVDEA